MQLFDLSPELICSVLDYLEPYDFESLALACHGTYRVLRPLPARRNVYRQACHKVTFGESLPSICSPAKTQTSEPVELKKLCTTRQLLIQIAQDPASIRYIQHLDLTGREFPVDSDDVAESDSVFSTSSEQDHILLESLATDLAVIFPTAQRLEARFP